MNTRKEEDSLGPVSVPAESYGGSFYTRAKSYFRISGVTAPPNFRVALANVKKAAAKVNAELGHLDMEYSKAIQKAADEFIEGKFDDFFDLDIYQAGAGTPFNMNLNEILANRANEMLGGKVGEYSHVHPNDHVNMAQSSNDVIPTAIRIAAYIELIQLQIEGENLVKSLNEKAQEFQNLLKVGRTHLQDAVPITLGQEFRAYASAISNALVRLKETSQELTRLGIGGTAVGTGINTHPEFAKMMCTEISILTGEKFSSAPNLFETTHSMGVFASVSSAVSLLAIEILRITNDLRLMASGPKAGLNEINLKEIEPGSSIMPGKVNPSILECMSMICVQISGMNHSVNLAAQQGQFELNWHTPLIMSDLLHEIEIMKTGMYMLTEHCVKDITANNDVLQGELDKSTALATALAPYMGYKEVADLVNESLEINVPLESLVPEEHKKHLQADEMTQPNRR
ncbi:aspartate ammonia-lyase [Patescibacteria group bacterium]|nr:aspartate ammonia-lyase [Patescibacteria group bacterium]